MPDEEVKKERKPSHPPPELAKKIPVTRLFPFPDHPFSVTDDDSMRELIDSVKANGVLTPAIVRPREEGGYEVVSGHRRLYAAKEAGLLTLPAIIREMTRDEAVTVTLTKSLMKHLSVP